MNLIVVDLMYENLSFPPRGGGLATPAVAFVLDPGGEDLGQFTKRQAAKSFYLQSTIYSFPVTNISTACFIWLSPWYTLTCFCKNPAQISGTIRQ